MRIPFDNKSHKRALRQARRLRESVRLAPMQADRDETPSRKAKRYGAASRGLRGIAYAVLALGLVTMPAMARGTGHALGSHHASHHASSSGHGSAMSGLRAFYGAK